LIIYIIAAIFTSLGLVVGLFAFVLGVIGAVVPIFTGVSVLPHLLPVSRELIIQ
jgi:uncharacterized membrane protein required for colicin V production